LSTRLYLRSGGKLRQWRGDADGIARAFAALPPQGAASLAALGDGGVVSELKVTLLDLIVLLLGLLVPVFAIGTAIVLAALPILA